MATGILLAGIGGQGILLASEIIARAAMFAGFDVKTNETHGMAQRGGVVIAQVRYGKKVHSPLISRGTARGLAAFEGVEALRASEYLASDGAAIISTERRVPVTVSSGAQTYPTDVAERAKRIFRNPLLLDAAKIAAECGEIRAANVVVIGALAAKLELDESAWHSAVAAAVKPKHLELNQRAFAAGWQLGIKH